MHARNCCFGRCGSKRFGYIQHFFLPVVAERVDGDYACAGLLRDGFGVALIKFRLHEDDLYVFGFAEVYQVFEVGGRGLFATFFDGNLVQVVVAGEVGEGGMVNHERFGGIRCGELTADEAVGVLDALAEGVVACHVVGLVGFIHLGEGFVGVAGEDKGVGSGVPHMRLYGMNMCVVTVTVGVVVAVVIVVEDEVDTFGGVEHLDVGGVVHQAVHPCLLEADVADAEIGFAVAQGDELLGDGVVRLRAGAFGHHADYFEFIACNGFGEVALRFDGDGDYRLVASFAVRGSGRTAGAGCHKEAGAEQEKGFHIF